jgi:hypothetical protein
VKRVAASLLVGLTLAVAATPAGPAAARDGGLQVLYRGDLAAPDLVADSTAHSLHGAIAGGGGGTVTSVSGPRHTRFLRFPGGSCPAAPCPQAIVRPAGSTTLVPGDAGAGRFSFGADIRLTEPPSTVAGMNVFQFGAAGAGLSQWKLQVDYGRPSCRWSDGTTVLLLPAGGPEFTLQAGTWYRVRCTRLGADLFETRVSHALTGRPVVPPSRQVLAMGPILPAGTTVIGGKRINATQSDVDTDQFHGDLDDISFWRA